MKLTGILILMVVCVAASCDTASETNRDIARADSLLCHNLVDSAAVLLDGLEPQSASDSAYYFVMGAEVSYRRGEPIDLDEVDYSIKYYMQHLDNRKLACAYYYMVCAYFVKDTFPNDCFILLKKAEHAADLTTDVNLKNKICSALTFANHADNHIDEALKYAKKEYGYALILENRRDIAYALIRMSLCYRHSGIKDSAEHYINKCRMLVDEVDDGDKSFIYNLLGEFCMEYDPNAALNYFRSALKCKKLPETYYNVAQIYLSRNDTSRWHAYCDSALSNAWYEEKIDILSDIAQSNYEDDNIAAYKRTTDMMLDTWKDFIKFEKDNLTLEIQRKYDFERQQAVYQRNIFICLTMIVVLVGLCVIIHQKRLRDRQSIIQKNLEAENHNLQLYNELCEAQNRIAEYEQNIQHLHNLLDVAESKEYDASKKQIAEILDRGKSVFEKIDKTVCVADDTEYWIYCIFYFKTKYPRRSKALFDNYSKLTTDEKLFVIIDDYFKKQDADIATILNISPVTVRTRRSKLKSKLS